MKKIPNLQLSKHHWALITGVILVLLAIYACFFNSKDDEDYQTIQADGQIQIRDYPNRIAIEITVLGDYKQATDEGYKLLTDYVNGNNSTQAKINTIEPLMHYSHNNMWTSSILIPASTPVNRLPLPKTPQIKINIIPAGHYAVIRFSGLWNDANFDAKLKQLRDYLDERKLQTDGGPIIALYNSHWSLSFLRRNEIMFLLANNLQS